MWSIGGNPKNVGLVYAVDLIPDISPKRIKVGFTSRPIGARLKQFATANPDAQLVGVWFGTHEDEKTVHHSIDGRLGDSEVFVCGDVKAVLAEIDAVMSDPSRWEGE